MLALEVCGGVFSFLLPLKRLGAQESRMRPGRWGLPFGDGVGYS